MTKIARHGNPYTAFKCKRCDRVDVFADDIDGLYWAFFWYRGKRFGWTSLHSAECFGTMDWQIDEYLGDYFLWVADDRTRMLEQRDHARKSYEWYCDTHAYYGTYLRRQGYTEWHPAKLDSITQRMTQLNAVRTVVHACQGAGI